MVHVIKDGPENLKKASQNPLSPWNEEKTTQTILIRKCLDFEEKIDQFILEVSQNKF